MAYASSSEILPRFDRIGPARDLEVLDRRATEQYIQNHGLTQDFFTGEHDKIGSLTLIERQFETDRYVYLGTTEDDRQAANAAGWEYLSIEEAADKANWELAPSDGVSRIDQVIVFF